MYFSQLDFRWNSVKKIYFSEAKKIKSKEKKENFDRFRDNLSDQGHFN